MEYEINMVFYEDSDFIKRADFCNKNGLIIKEIEPDENGRRRFKIIELYTPKDKYTMEIDELKDWFANYYEYHEQKYRRLYALKLYCDDGSHPYDKLLALYDEAEHKRRRIQELEVLINE